MDTGPVSSITVPGSHLGNPSNSALKSCPLKLWLKLLPVHADYVVGPSSLGPCLPSLLGWAVKGLCVI